MRRQFCHEVKKLGYKVFAQAVSITSYSDRELLDLVDLVNDLEPVCDVPCRHLRSAASG